MRYIIGIDTGGTYTDAVILDPGKKGEERIVKKAKAVTTHYDLSEGINNSIIELDLTDKEISMIDRVVLSTTLATNAIVENKIDAVGCIIIGEKPNKRLATEYIKSVAGKVNIKGRVIQDINETEVLRVVKELDPMVRAIAVSGMSSTRNPALEQKVKGIINSISNIPVTCGSEIVSQLGFWERTNTAIINAGLLGIINNFVNAIKVVMKKWNIKAPIYLVKGDGNIAKLDAIKTIPIDTSLSGCAASMIGSIYLTNIDEAVIADMGGTTTDIGVVRNKRVELSPSGAIIGGWNIRIKSAKLFTFGLGGDSEIIVQNDKVKIGPNRTIPVCRGGEGSVTPTDILHYTGEFCQWDVDSARKIIKEFADKENISVEKYVNIIKTQVTHMINENLAPYEVHSLPVCAIGAPAKIWYSLAAEQNNYGLIIPQHYEVANAVGAAAAIVQEKAEAIIRRGEDGYGYLIHTDFQRYSFTSMKGIIEKAIAEAEKNATEKIQQQNLELAQLTLERKDVYELNGKIIHKSYGNGQSIFIETTDPMEDGSRLVEIRIIAYARGKIFTGED